MRIPKEHGAWAMLYVPFAAGTLAAGQAARAHVPGLVLLLATITGLFLGRDSALAWLRARDRGQDARADAHAALWQLGGAMAGAVALLATRPPAAIVPLGCLGAVVFGIHIVQMRRRAARTVLGETLAIVALTLAAPAASLVGRGGGTAAAMVLWMLCLLFFASSVFHVKLQVLAVQPRRIAERRRMAAASVVYHALLLGGLVACVVAGRLPAVAVAAFLPVIGRAFASLRTRPARLDLKRAGVLEIVYSLVFLICVTLAAHAMRR